MHAPCLTHCIVQEHVLPPETLYAQVKIRRPFLEFNFWDLFMVGSAVKYLWFWVVNQFLSADGISVSVTRGNTPTGDARAFFGDSRLSGGGGTTSRRKVGVIKCAWGPCPMGPRLYSDKVASPPDRPLPLCPSRPNESLPSWFGLVGVLRWRRGLSMRDVHKQKRFRIGYNTVIEVHILSSRDSCTNRHMYTQTRPNFFFWKDRNWCRLRSNINNYVLFEMLENT